MTHDHPDPAPAPEPVKTRDDPANRAEKAKAAIRNALELHRCRILPMLSVDPVGASQPVSQALVRSEWVVVPEA